MLSLKLTGVQDKVSSSALSLTGQHLISKLKSASSLTHRKAVAVTFCDIRMHGNKS